MSSPRTTKHVDSKGMPELRAGVSCWFNASVGHRVATISPCLSVRRACTKVTLAAYCCRENAHQFHSSYRFLRVFPHSRPDDILFFANPFVCFVCINQEQLQGAPGAVLMPNLRRRLLVRRLGLTVSTSQRTVLSNTRGQLRIARPSLLFHIWQSCAPALSLQSSCPTAAWLAFETVPEMRCA